MWCAQCQAEVAAEVSADTRRVRCANCHAELMTTVAARSSTRTREARELLERWSNHRLFDPPSPGVPAPKGLLGDHETSPKPAAKKITPPLSPQGEAKSAEGNQESREDGSASASDEVRPRASLRLDAGEEAPGVPFARNHGPSDPARNDAASSQGRREDGLRIDSAHTSGGHSAPKDSSVWGHFTSPTARVDAPHSVPRPQTSIPGPQWSRFDTGHAPAPRPHARSEFREELRQSGEETAAPRRSNWTSTGGQALAYLGVVMMTIGTTLVLWGYFGGPQSYTPTGWLVTTAGQMLLFLGVVTLVSGGMEQTTDEVARRIDRLGERLIRIEQSSQGHGLRGPYIPADYYQGDGGSRSGDIPEKQRSGSSRRRFVPRRRPR